MGAKDEILIAKNIDGVDESLTCENVDTYNFNMGSVHLELGNLLENEVSQLATIQTQFVFWKSQNRSSICWCFFVVNDDFLMDLEHSQMLQYIICNLKIIIINVLAHIFVLNKKLIKYNKINKIILTKIHVDNVDPRFFVQKKAQLSKK